MVRIIDHGRSGEVEAHRQADGGDAGIARQLEGFEWEAPQGIRVLEFRRGHGLHKQDSRNSKVDGSPPRDIQCLQQGGAGAQHP